jgi:hypothetical protein
MKFHLSVTLSHEENILWFSFPNCEKSYIATGDSQCSLDFTSIQTSGYLVEDEFEIKERHPPPTLPAEECLHFEPDTSLEDSSEADDPDYQSFIQPYLLGSDER